MQYNLFLESIAVTGPGFQTWEEFCGQQGSPDFMRRPVIIPNEIHLPATERRRITPTIQLALTCAQQATAQLPAGNRAGVFASSNGDTDIMCYLGQILATETKAISPTKFHNSLHNAASGYWSIAEKNPKPVLAMAAGDETFCAGLMEAAGYCLIEREPVLFVAYDIESPAALRSHIAIDTSFAAAFVLSPEMTGFSKARIGLISEDSSGSCADTEYSSMNPIMQCIPLLQALTKKENSVVSLNYLSGQSLNMEIKLI